MMQPQGYSKRLRALDTDPALADATTIPEFCALVRIGRASFYKLPPEKRPEVITIGESKRITRAARKRWLDSLEARGDVA